MKRLTLLLTSVALGLTLLLAQEPTSQKPIETMKNHPAQPVEPVEKSEAEWKKELTPEQFRILRQAGTEAPNGKAYKQFKSQGPGTYYCAGCGTRLFSSEHKFDSGCGWPSFFDPADAENVILDVDYHLGYARTEVRCKGCNGHLGHVFSGEGFPTPTDKRYCINGTALVFVPDEPSKTEKAQKD